MKPSGGPFLFETTALGYLARGEDKAAAGWFRRYCDLFPVCIAAATVVEHLRGYALMLERASPGRAGSIRAARDAWIERLESGAVTVLPLDTAAAMVSAQINVLVPFSPHPPWRAGGMVESRPDRLARWRSEVSIAATALSRGMPLVHDNPRDYEPIRELALEFPARFPGIAVPEFHRARGLCERL